MKILTTICDDNFALLKKYLNGQEVKCVNEADEKFIASADILLFFHWRDAKKILLEMKNVKMIQSITSGVDYIDPSLIPKDAILCSNSGANAIGVAEHALALIFASLKKIVYRDMQMRRGKFPQSVESKLLRGKKIAIVGFGHIGQNIARMLSCFETDIYAINRSGKYRGDIGLKFIGTLKDVDYVLSQADIVVLSLPLTDETEGLIDMERLKKMKKDAILVNVARGKIIVERDLYYFLLNNRDFTAAIDTWWHYSSDFKQDYPFEELDNVILSPHCAGSYEGWFAEAIKHASENIMRFTRGEEPKNIVINGK